MSHELRTPLNSPADPREAAGGERRTATSPRSRSSSPDDPRGGRRPARPDQRHPRPVEGRGREDGRRRRRRAARRRARLRRADLPAGRRSRRGSSFDVEIARATCRRRIDTDEQRLQQVLKNLLSQRVQVHRAGRRDAAHRGRRRGGCDVRLADARRAPSTVIAFSVTDTGIGIPRGQAAAHLRGVPAGRRHDEPQVRRHRPRPLDQPRDRAPARRRDPRRERAGRGQHVHALPARDATSPLDRRRREAASAARRPSRGDALAGATARRSRRPRRRARPRPALVQQRACPTIATASARRPRRADRRGRRRASRAIAARHGARAAASRASSRCAATPALALARAVQARRDHARHRAAGHRRLDACSTASSTIRQTRHIPVHIVSGDDERRARPAPGRRRVPREAGRRRRRSTRRFDEIDELRRARACAACSSSRTTSDAAQRASSS